MGAVVLCVASAALGATFGRVVPIGGQASDIALDEARGVLYIANYTASRIDVMSLADHSISRSITVAPYPSSLALSPDGRYLLIAHYAPTTSTSSSGATTTTTTISPAGQNLLDVRNLATNQIQSFGLASAPLGVAFGGDGLALVLTADEFILFDPVSGQTSTLDSVVDVTNKILPVPLATFPPQILAAALTATPDGQHIYGITDSIRFSYSVVSRTITADVAYTASPTLGPRVISTSRDGSYYMAGWGLFGCGIGFLNDCTAGGPLIAQWPNASGALNVGSVAIRSSKSLIYAQLTPQAGPANLPPNLLVLDADNLTVRDRIQIPENLAGRSVFSSDESALYSISDSGVTVFSMAQLDNAPRVIASAEDVVIRGNFCNSGPISQQLSVADPSGKKTPFQICAQGKAACTAVDGITITPSAAVTPATVNITIDPGTLGSVTGTQAYVFEIRSPYAVNMPSPPAAGVAEASYQPGVTSRFRVLVNNRPPENRGAFFDVPGQLVDVLADPARNRFYVLRQDRNQVQVYDSGSFGLIKTLRTSNTPTQMAITFDQKYLLVGHNDSQLVYRYDLDTLQAVRPVVFPGGHYPNSIAASAKAVLALSRVAGGNPTIDRIDLVSGTASALPSLGPFQNGPKNDGIHLGTVLTAAPNGATILAAMPDGNVLLYDANADSFTVSRKDFTTLQGAYAASSFGNYVVDHYLLNKSLVPTGTTVPSGDSSSGFAFVNRNGLATAVRKTGGGYIQRVNTAQDPSLSTGMVEAPVTGTTDHPFTRTLAPLADQSGMVALTTSGFTVLPWNYDAAVNPPVLDQVVNAADFTQPVAPGGLISIFGSNLSPMTLASTDVPLPTVLADSCLTVNGQTIPMVFVSPSQINAQLPFQASGDAALVLHTPGGVSDSLNLTISPTAPSVFLSGTAGPDTRIPAIVRAANNQLVTVSDPIHLKDYLTIYATGLGQTSPAVDTGQGAPSDPLAAVVVTPQVTLGGVSLPVQFAGLSPGSVGVYQINVQVPAKGVPTGFDIPLTISQGGGATTVLVRVVN